MTTAAKTTDSQLHGTENLSLEAAVLARRSCCCICDGGLEVAVALPGLPLTDTFCREPVRQETMGLDQRLLFCPECGHAQLEAQIAPEILYGSNYCFRTSASATARKGTDFFLSVLEEMAPGRRFRCVLDLGCNDLYLLERLLARADVRIGIDPVWQGREEEREDKTIRLFGGGIESIDSGEFPERPDLVVCRHTLEHIFDPCKVVATLMELAAPDALFLFEVPGFDCLMNRLRFDQVFHQHLQYFSLGSFLRLLRRTGGNYLLHRENYHDWGAMAVAFTKANDSAAETPPAIKYELADIREGYELFRGQMRLTRLVMDRLRDEKMYGYGAAQMLPVLAYHMETDFSGLTAILDDDPAKTGIGYWNLPVTVAHPGQVPDLAASTVLITAIDNAKPLLGKLLLNRPRHIIYPLHII